MLKNDYYKICLRHMRKKDNVFMFWGENNSGYSKCIENSGLYQKKDVCLSKQIKEGDFLVHKTIIDKLKQKVRLPIYGDKEETYGNLNEFYVLPNTGQVRKELGITILDISLEDSNNSFNCHFGDTVKEILKYEYSKTHFHIKGKEDSFNEWWYYDIEVEAKTRDEAISKVFNSGDFGLTKHDCSFIEFKKKVTCFRVKKLVFDKWKELNTI
jgi:hypothetical protein